MSSVVPEGWELKPLSALADYHNGRAFKPEDWSKEGLPILRIAQINNPFRETDYYIGSDILDRHLIRKGDLVFSWSATLKAILWKEYNAILNQHIFKVIEKSHISRIFLQQLLEYSIEKLEESSHGSTMKHIKKGVLDEFHCPIPPLPEQKKIGSILTSVDEVIENTSRQINKLQDLKKATMNELLTKGIGHTEFKNSELGRIPKSWEVKKLGVFAKVKGGKRLPKGEQFSETMTEYPYIRVSDFENQGINKTRLKYVSGRVRESIKRYVISSKDLYISIAGSIGIIGTIPDELSGSLLTENAAKIVLESNVITRDFLKCNLSSEIAQSQFRQEKGTGGGVPKLALFRIEETLVALPKIDEQLQISSTIASLDKAISDMDSKLSQTQSLKKSLVQDLLTGKVRVNVN